MSRTQKTQSKQDTDGGFQTNVLSLLEWLADRDPSRAATLINEYLDELAEEMGGARGAPAKS